MAFTKFSLKHYKSKTADQATHLQMGGKYKGKYNIPLKHKLDVYKLVQNEPAICLTEKPTNIFPMYFDIDNEPDIDLEEIIEDIIIPSIKKVVKVKKNQLTYYNLQNKSKQGYYHIHFPDVTVNFNTAIKIATLINKENTIIDTSVYKTGLRLLNSFKPQKNDNTKAEPNTNYEFIDKTLNQKPLEDIIELVSIQTNKEALPIKKKKKKIIMNDLDDDTNTQELVIEDQDNSVISERAKENIQALLCKKFGKRIYKIKKCDNSFKVTSDNFCFVTKQTHTDKEQSCLYINSSSWVTASCLAPDHNQSKIRVDTTFKKIKMILGLIKSDQEQNDFQKLILELTKHAEKNDYKRFNGYVMKRDPKIPILYNRYMEYKDYINLVFTDEAEQEHYLLYRKTTFTHKNLVNYLEKYEDLKFPFMAVNKYVFAFQDGYLDISDLYNIKFTSYDEMNAKKAPTTKIFYNYKFKQEWLSNLDSLTTPKFDKVCQYHFQNNEIYNIFLGMIGRLHYPIHKYDKFNCLIFIKGGSNTGKSTTGNICMSSFQNTGTISANFEDKFGLESLRDKDVIYVPECPKNVHKTLPKTNMQRMIEGSQISIARKGLPALTDYEWKIPMLWLGNFFMEYADSSGAIPRRLCVFYMDRFVDPSARDTTLEQSCIEEEGHKILLKTIYMYKKLIERFGNKTFEDWGIEYFKKGYEELMTDCNYLYKFLSIAPGDFDYWPVLEEGAEFPINGKNKFKNIFEYYLKVEKAKTKKWKKDVTTLGRMGYQIITKSLCGYCGKEYDKTAKKCCEKFDTRNIRNKEYIKNMIIRKKSEWEGRDVHSDDEDD